MAIAFGMSSTIALDTSDTDKRGQNKIHGLVKAGIGALPSPRAS